MILASQAKDDGFNSHMGYCVIRPMVRASVCEAEEVGSIPTWHTLTLNYLMFENLNKRKTGTSFVHFCRYGLTAMILPCQRSDVGSTPIIGFIL